MQTTNSAPHQGVDVIYLHSFWAISIELPHRLVVGDRQPLRGSVQLTSATPCVLCDLGSVVGAFPHPALFRMVASIGPRSRSLFIEIGSIIGSTISCSFTGPTQAVCPAICCCLTRCVRSRLAEAKASALHATIVADKPRRVVTSSARFTRGVLLFTGLKSERARGQTSTPTSQQPFARKEPYLQVLSQ